MSQNDPFSTGSVVWGALFMPHPQLPFGMVFLIHLEHFISVMRSPMFKKKPNKLASIILLADVQKKDKMPTSRRM